MFIFYVMMMCDTTYIVDEDLVVIGYDLSL
jgi:hypothetical protein